MIPSAEQLQGDLERHASRTGEVYPSTVRLLAAEHRWSGRLWEVLELITPDLETMRYLAGGARPDEIVQCAARWAETTLTLDDISLVIRSGGYDPDPFTAIAADGLLDDALRTPSGAPRLVDGERAGAWISDQLALVEPAGVIEQTRRMIARTGPGAVGAY